MPGSPAHWGQGGDELETVRLDDNPGVVYVNGGQCLAIMGVHNSGAVTHMGLVSAAIHPAIDLMLSMHWACIVDVLC
jgi:hypothetical protein